MKQNFSQKQLGNSFNYEMYKSLNQTPSNRTNKNFDSTPNSNI